MYSKINVLCLVFIFLLGGNAISAEKKASEKSRFEKLELFNKVLFLIESNYYRDVDTEKLIQGAIKGMMGTLDPHSSFLDDEVYSKMQEDTQGEFGGLGIEVSQKDGVMVVITPIDDTPAFKAGMKAGDRIVEINHESTIGMTLEEAVDRMRGKPDTKILVGVIRDGVDGIKYFDLKRTVIKIEPVKSKLLQDNIIYLRLTQFQKRSAESIIKAMKKHAPKKGKLKGIILDLRSNPGGLLDEAVDVSSIFLKDGVVVSTEGRDPKNKEIRFVKKEGFKDLDTPLVVLINGSSASASEIVAGALQDYKRAVLMGARSFGKGSVQTVAKIDEDKGVKLTIAQYMTPTGRKIQAVGIKPDIELAELEGDWLKKSVIESQYIREADLRNHLTATIETSDEKSIREQKEREERALRIKKIEERRKQKEATKQKPVTDSEYDLSSDYQVKEAMHFLEGISLYKKM